MIVASGEYMVKRNGNNDGELIGPIEIQRFKPSIYRKANYRDLQNYVDGYIDRLGRETGEDVFVSLTFTFLEETGHKTLNGLPVYYEKKEPITIKRVKERRENE